MTALGTVIQVTTPTPRVISAYTCNATGISYALGVMAVQYPQPRNIIPSSYAIAGTAQGGGYKAPLWGQLWPRGDSDGG